MDWGVSRQTLHPAARSDRAADRQSFLFLLLILIVSYVVNAWTTGFELSGGGEYPAAEPWVREFASHAGLLAVAPLVPLALNIAPVGPLTWRWAVPAQIGFSIVFSVIHILLMVYLRKAAYPLLFDQGYTFGLNDPLIWLYEYSKDAFTYLIVIIGFSQNRALHQRAIEVEASRETASTDKRLELKCGGRTIFVQAGDVISAQAASNYVEIQTGTGSHLARMTLAELERLLSAADMGHKRVHRSHIVNMNQVIEIVPTGEGDVTLHLRDGRTVPGSRRYRDTLVPAQA